MRFVFQQGGPLAVRRRQGDGKSYRVPAAPLSVTLRDPRFLIFFAVWVGLNALFGLGTLPIAGEGQEIAWQAHIGGFFAVFFSSTRSIQPCRAVNSLAPESGQAASRGCRIPLPSRKINRRWLHGWRSCATSYGARCCGAAGAGGTGHQKVPAGGTRHRQKRNPHTSVDPLCRGGPPFAVKRGRLR
jgi:hypothetical protein